jgi:hypothetical protein
VWPARWPAACKRGWRHADARISLHVQAFVQFENAQLFGKDSVSPVDKMKPYQCAARLFKRIKKEKETHRFRGRRRRSKKYGERNDGGPTVRLCVLLFAASADQAE